MLMFWPALEAAYYVCVVPWYFKSELIFVEEPWCIVHGILIVFNVLIFYSTQEFHPAYLHATYKLSTHLGGWKEIGGQIDEETVPWQENQRYFQARIVSHDKKRFKSTGKFINAAVPGFKLHRIFGNLFGESFLVYKLMVNKQINKQAYNYDFRRVFK